VIRVVDLAVSRGEERVLDGVDIAVDRGSFVGLVGPNGAGKTTLLRTLAGALDPDAGRVVLDGTDATALDQRAVARRVALVPQEPALDFSFSVRQVVEMGRHPHVPRFGDDDDPERVGAALDRTATAPLADRPVTELSGGERRRVLLARAVAQDTPALLLDEPTASLDVHHTVRTLELVSTLVADGRAALAAIHDLDVAARYCDELVVLADGAVVGAGTPEDVLTADVVERAFGGRATVGRDPVTGTPSVTALPDRERPRAGTVHVVGGGGRAAHLLAPLAAHFEVTVGAVPAGDRDAETAQALCLDAVTVPPFEPVDAAAERRVRERVAAADAVVVADVDLGEGAAANLDAAADADPLLLVEGRPLAERTRDRAARERYDALRSRAETVADDADAVVAAVGALTGDAPTGTEEVAADD
jgi:iron complex transport system ATP-binding protein